VTGIEAYAARLEAGGAPVHRDGDLPGHRRFYSYDPVGNRLEFLEPVSSP
ncbi:glyoxalase, partial [Streptomyces sp. NPDC047072]